ncbi:hypothetical protein ES707_12935 [subsurface metagenome]
MYHAGFKFVGDILKKIFENICYRLIIRCLKSMEANNMFCLMANETIEFVKERRGFL